MKRVSVLSFCFIASLIFSGQNLFAARQQKNNSGRQKNQIEKNAFASYPEEFSSLLSEALGHARNGDFEKAVGCFDERIYNFKKDETSEKNAVRIDLISADVQKQMREYKKIQLERSAKKLNFSNSADRVPLEGYFSNFAAIINKIRDLGQQIQSTGSSGYPYYLSRFILGISEEKDSGLAGTLELEFKAETDQLLGSVWNKCDTSSRIIADALSENKIFTDGTSIAEAEKEFTQIRNYIDELREINNLRGKLKNKKASSQKDENDFATSMNAMNAICSDGKKLIPAILNLQKELESKHTVPQDKVSSIRSENDSYASALISSASNLSAWGKTAAASAKLNSFFILDSLADERLSWKVITRSYRDAGSKTEAKCTQLAIAKWVAIADYYSQTGTVLFQEDSSAYERIKNYMEGKDGIYYPSRCMADLEVLKENINKDLSALEDCKIKLNNGYIYRSNFIRQQEVISEQTKKISELKQNFQSIEDDAKNRLLKAQLAKNEIEVYCSRAKSFNDRNNFQQSFSNYQTASNAYTRLTEDLKNDGDIQKEIFDKVSDLRNDIIEKQQPILNKELRTIKTQARTAYYAGDFEKASAHIGQADSKREMWSRLLDITMETDTELERIRNFVNTAIAIKEGREIHPYDAKAPEMRQNLSLAGKYFFQGESLLKEGKRNEAEKYLNMASEKINQVKIYYPRNKTASVLALRITKTLDPENFEDIFKSKVNELKQVDYSTRNSMAQESYSNLLDLYEMNSSYPGLKNMIESAEYSLGLKQKPADRSVLAKAEKLAQESQDLLNKAGRDTILLEQAKTKAQSAIEIDPENNKAIKVLDEIALRTGQQSAVILSSSDEALYQSALADLQKNKVFDANSKLTKLLQNSANSRSAKILKLKKRIEAQL